MNARERIQKALKREAGVRLSAAEVCWVANQLHIDLPAKERVATSVRTKRDPVEVHSRWMIRRDMDEVLQIEGACFEFPINGRDIVNLLRNRSTIGYVAEKDDAVVAFMIYKLKRTSIEIDDIAVDPGHQGRSVGSHLVNKLKSKLTGKKRTTIDVLVRESNTDALMFFKKMGFRATQIIHEAYDASDESAINMQFAVEPAFQSEFTTGKTNALTIWRDSDFDEDDELEGV